MRATTHIFLTIVVVTLLILGCQSTSTCHVLCNCTNSTCLSCYNNFESNSQQSAATSSTCPCPIGFYSLNNACLFCQDNCKVCSGPTTCLECYPGYTKINGTCINNKYAQDVTWVLYQCQKDFKLATSATPSLFGFSLLPVDPSVSSFFLTCSSISNQKLLGFKSTGNLALSLLRTYYGLPYHQWAHISIKYAVLDTWNGEMLQTELYLDAKLANKTYRNSQRNTNLCGGVEPDSLDQIHSQISHDKSTLAINFTIPANVTLAIYSIKIDVGTCARNCLSCSSPTNCLVCKSYYKNNNGICECNTTLSYPVTYGCLEKCGLSTYFAPGLERCSLCSIFITNCFNCPNSTICTQCNENYFLHEGKCVVNCPAQFYPKKMPDYTSTVPHCHACPANCTQCFNDTLCVQCQSNLYVLNGECVSSCPTGTTAGTGRCYPITMCGTGCESCNNRSVCTLCQLGFWMSGTICLYDCPAGTYRSTNRTCLSCSANCSQCLDRDTCQVCSSSFTLRNGTCQYYTTTCNKLGFYFDQRVRDCSICPTGCTTCLRDLCYTCGQGFFLDNGHCVTSCSAQKYKIDDNITNNNVCYWKNEICLDQFNITQNSCGKCRSLSYIVGLSADFTCKTYCQAGKTFSPHNYNLIENSRYCNVSCTTNCEICINSTVCVKCVSGYVISATAAGTCVTSCGTGYLSDSVQCLKCQYGCNTCDMNGNCLSWSITPTNTSCSSNCTRCIGSNCVACTTGFYLNQLGTCQTSCAAGTFMDTVTRQCRKCQPQCQECTAFSSCSKCINGFYLWGQTCLRECPQGTFPNQQLLSCDACSANCKTCYGPKPYQCLSCYLGYKKDHSECVVDCPVHKYEDPYEHCDWCHESCRYCFGPAEFQCLECGLLNYLYKGECFNQTCPAATYLAVPATRECKDCSRGCSQCNSSTYCHTCFPGFYPSNGECLDSCPANTYYSWQTSSCISCSSFCESCVSSTVCYQCDQTHYLYQGACISSCPNGTFPLDYYYGQDCRACPVNCLACVTSYQCTECNDGLILRNGQCTRYCEAGQYFYAGNDSCTACATNCASCTSWGCTQCQVGFYAYNGTCIQTCPATTYTIPQTGECGSCPSTCTSCTTFYQCTQCRTNYTLVNGVCRRNETCATNCLQCADANTCIVCRPGFFRFTNSSGIFCSSTCPSRYYLYAGSQCVICQAQCVSCTDNGCTQCQNGLILFMGQCIQDCYPGFYPTAVNSTVRCDPCSPLCQTCALQASNCITCWSPTAVVENGTCVEKRQCLLSAFFSESIGYCVPCTAYCKICHNPWECDQCLPGFFITEDKLCKRQCPNGQFLTPSIENPGVYQCRTCPFPCLNCISQNQCSNCLPGYPLNITNYQCQTNCDRSTGYFLNTLTNTCERCNERCLECTGTSTSCIQCSAGYYLIGNQCVLRCPEGTFPVLTARRCLPCGENCQSCTSQANCQTCLTNTVNFNGTCLPICPSGYYNANGACLPCVLPCRQCNGGSTYECSTCEQGYYFFNNRCIQTCPDGYFRHPPSSSCRACPTACRTCTSFTSCDTCQSGYTFNTVTQQCETVPVCPSTLPNCQSCVRNTTTNTTQCSYCYNGFYLRAGQCVPECSATYFENRLTGNCQPCQQNCLNCIDSNSCTQCATGFYLFNERCVQVCPNGTFPYVDNQTQNLPLNICRIDPCIHYVTVNSTQQCLICVSPFILFNGQCLEVCPVGTFRSELSCQPCATGCRQCIDLLHCTNCLTNYHFYEFQCPQNCPTGTYSYVRPNGTNLNASIQDGECLPCSDSCLICSSINQCTQCSAGFYLTTDGRCVTICPTGFYANFLTGDCQSCSPSCAQCLSLDTCRRCANGSYLIAGQCVTDCPAGTYPVSGQCRPCLQYCQVCGSSSNCTQCQAGYMLNRISNQCVQTCPVGTYVSVLEECLPCPTTCASCSNPNECISCRSPAILFNANCITQCPSGYTLSPITNTCIECDPYCRECKNVRDNCTACQQGYNLTNGYCTNNCSSHTFRNSAGQCQSCTSTTNNGSCSQCFGSAIDQCLECYSPYYLLNNVCVQICPEGFYPVTTINRECRPCDNACLNCAGSSRNCTSCPWGYYLVNGTCLASCPSRYYPNPNTTNYTCLPCIPPCLQCITQSSCTVCMTGYYITPFGDCAANCTTLQPTSTNLAYFLNTNTSSCEPCSSNCLSCTSSSRCTKCQPPSHLYLNQCVQDCPASTFLSYDNSCQRCNESYCTACISSTQCIECLAGVAYLLNGDCVIICPTGYVVLDGRCVINNDNQTVCTLYWLNTTNSSSCVEYCPTGYYPSNTTPRQCLPCSVGCQGCTSSSNCQICQPPYILLNNSCISTCPSGYIEVNGVCVRCDDSCRTCSPTPTDCTACPTNMYLFNGQCVAICPDGYYTDSTSKQCKRCAEPCLKCSSFSQCTQCKNTRYSPPSCRDNTCNSTQYKIQATGQCSNCDTNCLTCYGGSSSNCITCRTPLVMIDGQCRSECPISYVLVTANNSCTPCPINCRTCTFVSNSTAPRCTECYTPKILNNGICLDDCSTIATQIQSYTSNGTACYPCSANCLDCIVVNSSTSCTICAAGYILYQGQCISQCPNGFYPIQGSCSRCPQNCTSCSSDPNSCTACTNGTYLYNGNCIVPCPTETYTNTTTNNCVPCTDPQCIKCSTGANTCQQCTSPFTVDTTRSCRNCASGYIYNSVTRACDPCLDTCLTCSVVINNCTSCLAPRALIQARCVDQCPDTYYLFVVNTTRECRRCPTNCISCQLLTTNTTQCQQCAPGYYRNLANYQCVPQCPTNTFISNTTDCSPCSTECLTCNDTNSCTSCPTGSYRLNNRCINPCPTGYAPLNGSCQVCPVGCISCSTPTNCTTCRTDYTLNTTTRQCDEKLPCPSGKYPDLNGTCQNCSAQCSLCTSLQNCTQCKLPYFLLNGQCSQNCLSNQYSITVSISSTSAKFCKDCLSPCDRCTSNTSCTHCESGYFLTSNGSCVADCGDGYYGAITIVGNETYRNCTPCSDIQCKICTKDGCRECKNGSYLFGLIQPSLTNGSCVADCPSGYYKDSSMIPFSCKQCSIARCDKCNTTYCFACLPPYILLITNGTSSCVSACPDAMVPIITNGISKCQNCMPHCLQCYSAQWCRKCDTPYYLYLIGNITVGNRTNFNTSCVPECPESYFPLINAISHNNTCEECEPHCINCTNATHCIECYQPAYVLVNDDCIPYKCVNCTTCVNERCEECANGFFLFLDNSQCYEACPEGYWGNLDTKKCEICMDNCIKCPSKTNCQKCKDGFNFTGQACVDEAFIIYGVLSNMSGFTSNLTQITSAVYIGTSVGPMVFGEMTTTYFNIQFCQFILFHAKASGNNSEMSQFLGSLQSISLTMSGNSNQNSGGQRRLLAASLADPATFLVTSVPIFAMMGGFLLVFGMIHLFQKYANSCCLTCPRFHFYATEICQFMKKRFKWIYFDFVAWVSFLPFLYFSLMQLQKFSFATALEGFSCILSLVIVVVYPLYPFFIGYLLKKNYNDLVHENNQMVEMSLSPYVYKVKRPTKELVQGQPWKDYFTAQNLRLAYDPLKYLRKFLFVLIVAVCHDPIASLVILIIMNVIFIGYMAAFRPRQMPYMVFDFIIEGVLLFFEVFMLVYLTDDSLKVTAMSIAAHAVGFLTANLSLIIAIILNLIAYYKIFMCLYDMVKHLREKLHQKQKGDLRSSEIAQHDPEHQDMDLPEKDHDNLTKSLRGTNKLRKRNGEDATEFDQSEINNSGLIKDKEIYGNNDSGINGQLKRSNGGLPNLKSTKQLKKRHQQQLQENSQNYLFQDKQLPKRESVRNDDELTQQNPDSRISKIESGILKDKQLYKGSSGDIRISGSQIPDLKSSNKKKPAVYVVGSNVKLKNTPESDEDFMVRSGVSGQEIIAVQDGKIKEIGQNRFKRSSHLNPGDVAVTEGIPIKGSDKFRRNLNSLPKIQSVGEDLQDGKMREIDRNNGSRKDNELENARFKDVNRNRGNNNDIQEGQFTENKKRRTSVNKGKDNQIEEGKFKDNKRDKKIEQHRQQEPSDQIGYLDRKKNLIDIPVLGNQNKNQKISQSMDLLEASFVEQSPVNKNKQGNNSEVQDDQDIYNISLNARSANKKHNAQGKKIQDTKGIQEVGYKNVDKKPKQKNTAQDFDQFLEDNPQDVNLKQREKQVKRQNINEKVSQPSDIGELTTKQRNKKPTERKQEKQAVVEGGKLIEHKTDKFRRKAEKNTEQIDEQKLEYVDRQGKKKARSKKEIYLDQQQQIQEGKVKDRVKKKVGLQNELSQDQDPTNIINIDKKKAKKKFTANTDEGQLGDQYERAKRKEQTSSKNKRGHLGINEEGKAEQYDEIVRQNKNNMFSPDKGVLMDSLNVNDFNDSDYESRPQSKIQRPGSRGKGVLGVGDTGSAADSDDSNSVRHQRASAIQKLRKKQGNLGIDQKSDYSGDESVSSRQGKEKKAVRRRQKSSILKIEKNHNDVEGMDQIQLEKKR